jgi:hypothetical protein
MWLKRRVSRQAFLQETGDAIRHMDTRVTDSKLRSVRAVDIMETVLTALASISLSWRFPSTLRNKERLVD